MTYFSRASQFRLSRLGDGLPLPPGDGDRDRVRTERGEPRLAEGVPGGLVPVRRGGGVRGQPPPRGVRGRLPGGPRQPLRAPHDGRGRLLGHAARPALGEAEA